jgi:hypothetical protein
MRRTRGKHSGEIRCEPFSKMAARTSLLGYYWTYVKECSMNFSDLPPKS